MNKRELDKLETVLKDADNVIVITEKDGEIHLSFSQQLSEMEVLDILAIVTSKFYEIAEELMFHKNPSMHNQALMEFGALQCAPMSPKCNLCPIAESCFAHRNNLVKKFPIKSKKTNPSFYLCLTGHLTATNMKSATKNCMLIWDGQLRNAYMLQK